jgi:hypothetical protein
MTIIYLKIAANADGTTAYVRLLGEGKDVQQSPLWGKSRHVQRTSRCRLSANSGHRADLSQNSRNPSLAARASRAMTL